MMAERTRELIRAELNSSSSSGSDTSPTLTPALVIRATSTCFLLTGRLSPDWGLPRTLLLDQLAWPLSPALVLPPPSGGTQSLGLALLPAVQPRALPQDRARLCSRAGQLQLSPQRQMRRQRPGSSRLRRRAPVRLLRPTRRCRPICRQTPRSMSSPSW
jgi:hypothetical protein